MKAAIARRFGGPEVLSVEEGLPLPSPRPGQVLLRLRAAALNPLDAAHRSGALRPVTRPPLPFVPGNDAAGEIAALGEGVGGWSVGDRVFCFLDSNPAMADHGFAGTGSCAQYAVTRADTLARIPAALDFQAAAALPLAALTAWRALAVRATLRPGMKVLVNGASGGVGTAAVQVAAALGATVHATCGAASAGLVASLGAARVIDYRKEDFRASGERYDVIYDVAVATSFRACRRALVPGGIFISNLASPLRVLLYPLLGDRPLRRGSAFTWVLPSGADLARVAALVDGGKLRPVVGAIHPLEDIVGAHRRLEAGGTAGKIVISIG